MIITTYVINNIIVIIMIVVGIIVITTQGEITWPLISLYKLTPMVTRVKEMITNKKSA